MKFPIYLDNHSTTPLDPRVLEAMMPYLTDHFGNAASRSHSFGWEAEEGVEKARKQIANLIGASSKEIIFTSGATESINRVFKGAAEMYASKGNHFITQVTEHKATLDSAKYLEKAGASVTYLPVNRYGQVDPEAVRQAITDKTVLVSILHANNEVGTLQPIAAIGAITREKGVLLHVDAAQTVGKIPVDVNSLNIDLLSISGHKLYGTKGRRCSLCPARKPARSALSLMHGGGHERGMRSGTLNVPAIVGLGEACAVAQTDMVADRERVVALRDRLHKGITSQLDEVYLNGHPTDRLYNNLNLSFAFVEGEALMMGLREVAVSSGFRLYLGVPGALLCAQGAGGGRRPSAHFDRFGLGRFNTEEEIDYVIDRVVETVSRLREMSPSMKWPKKAWI